MSSIVPKNACIRNDEINISNGENVTEKSLRSLESDLILCSIMFSLFRS